MPSWILWKWEMLRDRQKKVVPKSGYRNMVASFDIWCRYHIDFGDDWFNELDIKWMSDY